MSKYGYMICPKSKLRFKPLANQKLKKIHTISNVNYSKKAQNRIVLM